MIASQIGLFGVPPPRPNVRSSATAHSTNQPRLNGRSALIPAATTRIPPRAYVAAAEWLATQQRRDRVRELCDLISESSDERDDLRIGADDLDSYELVPKIR